MLFPSSGIVTSSDDTRILNNMVAHVIYTGTYQDRYETFNPRWEAGIEAIDAESLTLQDNVVVGSERAGYHVKLLGCDDTSGRYSNNEAYSSLDGAYILPADQVSGDCVMLSGFIFWKNHDFGFYYQNGPSVKVDNAILVENGIGIYFAILGPSAVAHIVGDQKGYVSNTLLVGATASFDCSSDVSPSDDSFTISGQARPGRPPTGGMIGITFPNFNQGDNEAPVKKWTGIMAYNCIAGLMKVTSK